MSDIIVCSEEPQSRKAIGLSLGALGKSISFAHSLDELKAQSIAQSATTILVFDFEFIEKIDDESLKHLESQFSGPFILLSSRELHMNVAQMKRSERIGHVISRKDGDMEEDLKKVLEQILKQRSGPSFAVGDVRDIFHVDSAKVKSFFLEDSSERWECYKNLSDYVKDLPTFSGFDDIAATVASELITNAFYNGPRSGGQDDKALYPSRAEQVKLIPPKKVEFCYWSDDENFWVMVIDPFGSLKKSRLISALHRAVTERSANLEDMGGAGLGLTMIAEWASELYFGLLEAQSTWIAARLRITKRRKLFFDQRSSLHIYEIRQNSSGQDE